MENDNLIIDKINEILTQAKNDILQYWHNLAKDQIEAIVDYESLISQLQLAYTLSRTEVEIAMYMILRQRKLLPLDLYPDQLKQALYNSTSAANGNLTRVIKRSINNKKN